MPLQQRRYSWANKNIFTSGRSWSCQQLVWVA